MQETAERKVERFLKETGMLDGCSGLIAGVSGGADSVFLFYVLLAVRKAEGIPFRVVHVHHGLRGEEADRDADYVKSLCEQEAVPFSLHKRDIRAEAALKKRTVEEAGRYARYEIFEEELKGHPGAKLALAHHKNDVAETVLFNLARGTGLMGLSGIRPVRGSYIRPLLAVTRDEIEESLARRKIPFMTDSTNEEDDAARNRIRHHVLPYMKKELNAQAVSHIADTARMAGEAADFIRSEAVRRSSFYMEEKDGGTEISVRMTGEETRIMQEEIIRYVVESTVSSLKDISALHIRLILGLFERETGKFLNLPGGLTATKKRACVRIEKLSGPKRTAKKH